MRLTANTTPTDEARAYRSMLAWLDGDKMALDVVLAEVMRDPTGVPGLLFVLLEIASDMSMRVNPDVGVWLRAALLRLGEEE
jgi:hypothetical protein